MKTYMEQRNALNAKTVLFKKVKRFMQLYILFIPVLIYYVVFKYAPMAGIVIAFKKYNFLDGVFGSPWVGLANFKQFFTNSTFWIVVKNTFILASLRILLGFPAPIIFALLLNELKFSKIKRIIQTVSYLPHFISWVIIYGLLYNLFSSSGLVNQMLELLGKGTIQFLSMPKYFRGIFIGSSIWKELGWGSIVYLAALSSIDTELYAAAQIDGANRLRQLWHITLPGIRNVISIMFVLRLGQILEVNFEQVMVMINPAVYSVAEVLSYHIYNRGLLDINNFGYGTAVGVFKSIISLILVLFTNWGAKKIDEEGAIW